MTKVVVLDAGHGLYTAGKQTMNGSKGVIKEWSLNNPVAKFTEAYLKENYEGVKVYRSDDTTGKTDKSLSSRAKYADSKGADLFVSFHHNAGRGTGIEVYYHTDGTEADKEVAKIIAPKLAEALDCRNRGVKHEEFGVLNCKSTAVLVEGLFMDTEEDYDKMVQEKYQRAYAKAVAESIAEYLELEKKKNDQVKPSKYQVGDKIKVVGDNYATGQTIPDWVKKETYDVTAVRGDQACLSRINSWVYFKDLDEVSMTNLAKPEQSKTYQVKIKCDSLNVREKADFNSKVVTTVKKDEVYTIVGESNGLGKLKSGKGYISLNSKYVSKL